ncbi:MAG: hypothetical protein WA058_01585 [Minisyncoccia bacterium]
MDATQGIAQVSTLATQYSLSAWSSASDFLIIIVLVSLLFFYGWYVGRGPFVAILLAIYAGYAVYVAFPYASLLPTAPALTALLAQAGVYLGVSFVFFIVLRRVVVSDFLYVGVFGLIALSFFATGFLLALAYHVFPVAPVYHFTPAMDLLFASKQYFFWWFIAPAVGLFFLAR